MKLRKRATVKAALLSAAAIATSLLIGMSAACAAPENPEDEDENKVTKQDTQVIKNGNFEFYDDNEGLYPISTPDNWTSGSNGSTSSAMGGIINTSKERWDYFADPSFAETLEANNSLDSDDDNRKDYGGALTDDLPYKNTHAATDTDPSDEDKAFIDNPFTHEYKYNAEGKLTDKDGNLITTYEKDGKTYTDSDCTKELETSILMLHNYRPSYNKGTETYYSSSSTVTLEARTAAKLSVWVKTAELYFDGAKNERTEVKNEHGAYIKVDASVGGNSLDSFCIRNINTEQLNPDENDNGWVQYTVFIQASSFSTTTFTITLGLGQDEVYTVEGYAFFDDIQLEQYDDAAQMIEKAEETLGDGNFAKNTENSTATLLDPEAESEFRVDKMSGMTDGGEGGKSTEWHKDYNFADRYFYIDLAGSENADNKVALSQTSVAAGLTVDDTTNGKYVSSKDTSYKTSCVGTLDNGAGNAYLPSGFDGITTSSDLLATFDIADSESWQFNEIAGYDYNDLLTKALAGAAKLPGAKGSTTDALLIMSANGAAYEAKLSDSSFTLQPDTRVLITFWLKTSEMNGNTAATITVKEVGKEDENTNSFSLDTTTLDGVTIGEKEDYYDGWTECFIRVENTSEEEKSFSVAFNFGNTAISGTAKKDYHFGWMSVANMSILELEENVYNYTSGLSNTASLTLSDEESETTDAFDTEMGDKNVIKTDLAIPSQYSGTNGASANVTAKSTNEDYDATNRNDYAGLLNKEYLDNYRSCDWFSAIKAIQTLTDNESIWSTLAGKYSVQPLIIVNAVRDIADMGAKIYNYGYIKEKATLSADGYDAVSVKVKVSEGAVANIYLVESDSANRDTLSFSLPKFTFWYDDDGNILKGEPAEKASVAQLKENIAYTLRSDGLYDSVEKDGKLYANFYNLKKDFLDLDFEPKAGADSVSYYDSEGNAVNYNDLKEGEIYYANAAKTAYAPHYLVAGGEKVYKYNTGTGDNAIYYYMVDNAADTSKVVYGIDTDKAQLRYDNTSESKYEYKFTIDATTEEGKAKYADKWITVTFYLHAGSEEKSYKLELWSGSRYEQTTEGVEDGSYVLFDYNNESINETSFNDKVNYYTQAIIDKYKAEMSDGSDKLSDNIKDYEKAVTAAKAEEIRKSTFNYAAEYYTYTLYDSDLYVPFNGDTAADDETGYAYNYSDYSESLAYLKIEDSDNGVMSVFADYSLFDKDISLGKQSAVEPDDDDTTTTDSGDSTNFWLLFSSIILLAAILVALLVILGKDLFKKLRRNKNSSGKNTYNFNKNKRYVRKYVKANGEVGNIEEGEVDSELLKDKQPEEEKPENVENAEDAEGAESEAPAENVEEGESSDKNDGGEDENK